MDSYIFVLKSNPYIKCTEQNKTILKIFHNYAMTLWFRGWGYFYRPNFISQKVIVSSGIHQSRWKYNVCDIKLETKVMRLHTFLVEKIASFLQNKYAVHDF